jgi:hypothetical protein
MRGCDSERQFKSFRVLESPSRVFKNGLGAFDSLETMRGSMFYLQLGNALARETFRKQEQDRFGVQSKKDW